MSVLVGLASPQLVQRVQVKATSLNPDKPVPVPIGPFVLKSPVLSRYNQQLWLMAKFIIENNDETFSKNFTMMTSVIGLDKEQCSSKFDHDVLSCTSVYFRHSQKNTSTVHPCYSIVIKVFTKGEIIGHRKHNRTRTLECSGASCKTIIIMHLGYLPDSLYLVNASFLGFDHYSYSVKDVLFTWATYNPAFSQLELVIRFLFFVVALGVLVYYVHSLQVYPIRDWSIGSFKYYASLISNLDLLSTDGPKPNNLPILIDFMIFDLSPQSSAGSAVFCSSSSSSTIRCSPSASPAPALPLPYWTPSFRPPSSSACWGSGSAASMD